MLDSELRKSCVNTIRFLAADAVEKAKSGHPGAPMGMADMAFVLWNQFLRYDPDDPDWKNRDRFVPLGRSCFDAALFLASPSRLQAEHG